MPRTMTTCVWAMWVAAVAGAVAAETEWTEVYDGSVNPAERGWGSNRGANTAAEVTADGLLLIDSGTAPTELHCYSRSWSAHPSRGALVRAVVKVSSCSSRSGVCILTADGDHEDGLTLYPDRIVLSGADMVHDMDTTDRFHTYEIRISGINIDVRVDGEVVLDGWGRFTKPAHNGRCTLTFGSISSAATSEAVWREVRYRVNMVPVETVAGARHMVIYRRPGIYACFPTLHRLADGRLYTSFGTRVRRSHIDGTGGSAHAVSGDEGETWQLIEEPHGDPRFERDDGAVVVPHAQGWVHVAASEEDRVEASGRTWRPVREGTIAYLGDPRVRVTLPDGRTELIEFATPAAGGVMTYHHAASFVRYENIWLAAVYGGSSRDGNRGVWALRSTDGGYTWGIVTVARPDSVGRGFNETAVCRNAAGELVALMRPADERMNTYAAISTDDGATWSPPRDSGFWGYPCHLLLLRDGRLLATRGYRRDGMGVRAVLSNDGGHTWDTAHDFALRVDGRGSPGDNGYPISLQMSDGHIFTIYYITDHEGVTHVAGTHWDVPATE